MKLRHIRKRAQRAMDTRNWLACEEDTRMYFIRKIKPCKTYTAWCGNCTAVKFRLVHGRFPHNLGEMHAFEDAEQALEGPW